MSFPKSEISDELLPTTHECWLKLGRETCNMSNWASHCFFIMQRKYGKSHETSQRFNSLCNFFVHIQGNLDSYLLTSYKQGTESDKKFSEALRAYTGDGKYKITDVFYNIGNIERPNFDHVDDGGKLPKTLSIEECAYITEYKSRLKKYVEYLKSVEPHLKNLSVMNCEAHRRFPKNIQGLDERRKKL